MLQLDVLRLFVQQRLSAVTDDICRYLSRTLTEYERELHRLRQEVDRQRRLLEDRPRDTAGDTPEGALPGFTTEEDKQVRGWGFGLHIKQEEGGASGPEEINGQFMQSPDWLRETPETDQSPSANQILSCGEQVGSHAAVSAQVFTTEEELQLRGRSFSQVKQEEGGASGETEFTQSPDWLIENNDDGRPSSNHSCSHREDGQLMRPDPIVQSASSTEDSDDTQSQSAFMGTQGTRGTRGTRPPVDQRLLVCGSCGREFSSKRTLRKHIRRNSSQDQDQMSCSLRRPRAPFQSPAKTFSCRVCGSCFYTQGILVRHAENHCKEPESRCGACGDHLESTESLRDHLRSHKELGSTCDVCGRKCSSIRRMEIHRRVHTGEKPYRCGFCSRDFSRKESLERHLKVHSGDRPHSCRLCRRTFTRREYLVQHLETDHTQRPGPPAGIERTERPGPSVGTERPDPPAGTERPGPSVGTERPSPHAGTGRMEPFTVMSN